MTLIVGAERKECGVNLTYLLKFLEVKGHQKEVKDKAVQRQIELMKKKLKQKSEL